MTEGDVAGIPEAWQRESVSLKWELALRLGNEFPLCHAEETACPIG